LNDFLPIGLDTTYLRIIREVLTRESQLNLIILPESIALGAMRLDGSSSHTKPPERQTSRSAWDAQVHALLNDSKAAVVIGLDTVEQGQDHNTLVAWTREGTIGWYHKQGLVPFLEYIPAGWNRVAIRGQSQYSPGHDSQLIHVSPKLVLGGFICQEVLFPWVTRQSARDGATVLVSGGNDGVFADPAVAHIHADAAQLRAVETGRYLVRAMKTGISAVIDPTGREAVRGELSDAALLISQITPETAQTIYMYMRFGDWVVALSALVCLGLGLSARGRRRQS